jgi:hypothetical protein
VRLPLLLVALCPLSLTFDARILTANPLTGGLVWKTHAFASPSVHARQNAKVSLLAHCRSGTSSPSHDACLCLQKRRLAAEDVRLTLQDAAIREGGEAQFAAAEATQPSS